MQYLKYGEEIHLFLVSILTNETILQKNLKKRKIQILDLFRFHNKNFKKFLFPKFFNKINENIGQNG
jgi:hypothetical protein